MGDRWLLQTRFASWLATCLVIIAGLSPYASAQTAAPSSVAQAMAAIATKQLAAIDTVVPRPANANVTNWPDMTCPRCNAGLGEAAAVVAYVNHDPVMLKKAESIFDDVIARAPQPGLIQGATNENGPGEGTMFYIDELEPSLMMLRPQLDAVHIQRWTQVITQAASWEVADGDLTYYANGNVNIGMAGVMAAAYHETGNPAYLADYTTAMAFVEHPTLPRWKGYGFVVTKAATTADGSDGAGYFTESGVNGTGLDIDYTQFQEEQLTRIYLINHDPKVLYFMNMLINTLMSKVNLATMTLDSSGGTRHPQTSPPRLISFNTAGFDILVAHGRTDLAPYLAAQLSEVSRFYGMTTAYSPGFYYGLGATPGSLAINSLNLFGEAHTPARSTDEVAPVQPTGMTATVTGPTSVNLRWQAATDTSGIAEYLVRRSGPTSNYPYATVAGTVTNFTDSQALPNTHYTYSVQAVDTAGNVSIKSSGVAVTTPASSVGLSGDINGDGKIDALDLSILLSHWGMSYVAADFNHDGLITILDLSVLLSHWNFSAGGAR